MMIINIQSARPPHKGEVTHHHDQSITCVNFNTKNVMNNRLLKPMLFDVVLSLLMIICF